MFFLQDELKKFKKKSVNSYYNNALDLVKDNNISKAISLIELSFENITEDAEILNLMGICQYVLCNFDKASLYWNKSLMVDGQNNRAKVYMDYLNSEKFKNFIDYYNLSITYIEKFEYENAIELLLEINKSNEDLIEPYALIGNCYYALQEYDLAKKYLDKALSRDVDNIKYLKYINKINTSLPANKKKGKNYKMLIFSIAALLVIISLSFYWKYSRDMKSFKAELERTKSDYSELEKKIKDENKEVQGVKEVKEVEENDKKDEEDKEEKINEEEFTGNDFETLEEAMEAFGDKDYDKAIKRFQYLINTSTNDDVLSESIYYLAVSFEKEKSYEKAKEYYQSYIDKYRSRNYYDDSLYNYGLMLYENKEIKESKKVLNKLKQEEGDSIFVNSKLKSILED